MRSKTAPWKIWLPDNSWEAEEEDGEQPGEDGEWTLHPHRRHEATVLWLHSCHGRPGHIQDLVDDLRRLGLLRKGSVRIVAPCAPSRPCGQEWGGASYQWFEYNGEEAGDTEVGQLLEPPGWAQLRAQRKRLLRVLESELKRLPHHGRLVLGGLSQGGSMALDLLLHFESKDPALRRKIAGLFVRRTLLQPESVQDFLERPGARSYFGDIPILATHGTEDEYVPIGQAWESYDFLFKSGASLDFLTLDGIWHNGSSIEEANAVAKFVQSALCSQR